MPPPSEADAVKIREVIAFEKQCDEAAVNGDVAFRDRALRSDSHRTVKGPVREDDE